MSELNTLKNHLDQKSKNTEILYLRYYQKMKNYFNIDLQDVDIEDFRMYADDLDVSANTRAMYLNVYFVVKKITGAPNEDLDELKDYRNELLVDIQNNLEQVNSNLDLPKHKDLVNYMNGAYSLKQYKRYIINYLLLTYYVRNEDINVIITADDTDLKTDQNYLILKNNPKHVVYIRNKYKTANKHGSKVHNILNKDFYIAVRDLFDKGETNLLLKSIHFDVKNNTHLKIGEGKYLKCCINNIRDSGNINILKNISESRGTAYGVLLNSYNTGF